jgi:hypothetical protein
LKERGVLDSKLEDIENELLIIHLASLCFQEYYSAEENSREADGVVRISIQGILKKINE